MVAKCLDTCLDVILRAPPPEVRVLPVLGSSDCLEYPKVFLDRVRSRGIWSRHEQPYTSFLAHVFYFI